MTTIGVHTHITNPLTSGYMGYLACVESWAKVADQVVVVDGGSTDDSIPVLMDWLGPLANRVRVISTEETHWGTGEKWFWPQIAINRQVGFSSLDTDWAIHVDADHVLADCVNRDLLERELQSVREHLVSSFWVSAFENGTLVQRTRSRAWIVNRNRTLHQDTQTGYGIDAKSGSHLDYPIGVCLIHTFVDPSNRAQKQYLLGNYIQSSGVVDIDTVRYGHFFFSPTQCIHKCRRLDLMLSRFCGNAPSRTRSLVIQNQIPDEYVLHHLSCERLLEQDHPTPVKHVIRDYFSPAFLGAMIARQPHTTERLLLDILRVERRLRTAWMYARGYRGAVDRQRHAILPHSKHPDQPLDVCQLYTEQNEFLPKWAVIGETYETQKLMHCKI